MKNLFIFGTGFFDFKLIEAINRVEPTWKICGFLYHNKNKIPSPYTLHYPVLGGPERLPELARDQNNYFINNEFNNEEYAHLLLSNGCQIATLIHPSVDVAMNQIGMGCIIPEGCVIGTNTKIGDFVTFRLMGLVSHDVVVENHVFIGPRATIGGKAVLKKNTFIGLGAIVMSHRIVGENSTVGAGAVVTKDVAPGSVVAGVPAKPLNRRVNK